MPPQRYLDIDDVSFFQKEDLYSYEGTPDFLASSSHLKQLFSAPYNREKPVSLKVSKEGETLRLNHMHPLLGNTVGARRYLQHSDP